VHFYENLKIAIKAIIANKVRTFLTVLGIVIGVGAVILMMALGQGARDEIVSELEGLGSNIIVVLPGDIDFQDSSAFSSGAQVFGDATLTSDDLDKLKESLEDKVKTVSGVVIASGKVEYRNKSKTPLIFGTDESFIKGQTLTLDKGRFISKNDMRQKRKVAFLGFEAVENLFGTENPLEKEIIVNGDNYQVIGVAKDTGEIAIGPSYNNSVAIPATTAQKYIQKADTVDRILIDAKTPAEIETIKTEVEKILLRSHGGEKDFSILTEKEIISVLDSVLGILTAFLAGIASISLLVGGIGIMNIMLVSVTERTKEIGIRKAVGATNRNILVQFLTEAILISLLGGVTGVVISILASIIISNSVGFSLSVTLNSVLLAFLVSVSIGVFFGVAPAIRASRLDPIEALRHE